MAYLEKLRDVSFASKLGKKKLLEASVDSNHVSYDIAVAHLNDDSQLRKTDIVEAIGCKQT